MNTQIDQARQFATEGMQALGRQDGPVAERAFQKAIELGWPGPDIWVSLATAFSMQGNTPGRLQALKQALIIDPANARANLYMGDSAAFDGQKQHAARFFRRGLITAEGMAERNSELYTLIGLAHKFFAENPGIEAGQVDALVNSMGLGGHPEDETFLQAMDILAGRKRRYVSEPTRFFYPGLPDKQFYERGDFNWVDMLEAKTPAILNELQGLIARQTASDFKPYVEASGREAADAKHPLLDNQDWSAFYLMKQGKPVEQNIALCPQTFAAVNAIGPDVNPPYAPSILFSKLTPGTRIPPHTGMLNTRLICHLPLIIPDKCGFRVGNDTRAWEPGKMFIFDDSINHEAWNLSDENRYVLIFEIWRPELSMRERNLLTRFFEATNNPPQN